MGRDSKSAAQETQFFVKSLHDPLARREAVELVKKGEPVGIYNRGVCAIWGDGNSSKFYEKVTQIKGEGRAKKPLATTLKTRDFVSLIDSDEVPEILHSVLLNAGRLAGRVGSLCFLRMPIKREIAEKFPDYIVSKNEDGKYEMQNWDAAGHTQTNAFVKLLLKNGISLPAVTSMNISGSPEIVDQKEGIDFARKTGIKLFLIDEKDPGLAKGSFTILGIGKSGLKIIRDGHVPGHIFPYLLQMEVDVNDAIPAKYPQIEFPQGFFEEGTPTRLRRKVIDYITAVESKEILPNGK